MNYILKHHCDTGHFSHSYLLIGDRRVSHNSARKMTSILLNCEESLLDSHPDFLEESLELFNLEKSNELKQKFSIKPIYSERKVFLLDVASFDYEAAIAFSRIIENIFETCYVFFISAFATDVPLALRSRLVNIFEGNFKLGEDKKIFYEKFLKAGPVQRLALVKDAAGDKKIALEFLNELEIMLSEKMEKEKRPVIDALVSSLEELRKNRSFLFDRAPSPRMIVEHLALTMPKF